MNVYDFQNCNVIIDGHMAVDLGSGNPVQISYNSDRITPYVGAKGESSASLTNDFSATLTLTLQHTSKTNNKLDSLDGEQFDISFVDKNDEGDVKANPSGCMIQTYADQQRGTEITERQWTIYIPKLRYR